MSFDKKTCLLFFQLNWLLSPLATQGYAPTMPLLITQVMALPTSDLGLVYSTKMFCSFVGSCLTIASSPIMPSICSCRFESFAV